MKRIVVIGGGAGGLELATQLGEKLGRKKQAEIVLIDRNNTHLWKPLLHEVAAGSLDSDLDELSYRGHGAQHGFRFLLGDFCGIDRDNKTVTLRPLTDSDDELVLGERHISYDIVVLAIGSVTQDFGISGIAEHCWFLDSTEQAERFHQKLLNQFLRINQRIEDGAEEQLSVGIVGGGATGVELAAELVHSVKLLSIYGLDKLDRSHLSITLLEAGPRLLPALPERLASDVEKQLQQLGVNVRVDTAVTSAQAGRLDIGDEEQLRTDLQVWAAGVKAPEFISELGLTTRKNNQLVVDQYLRSIDDDSIYVIGDCAGFQMADDNWAPPRAQTAHQMAATAAKNIRKQLADKPLTSFKYKDRGSLVSLSRFTAVGNLMGSRSLSMTVEGRLARLAYASLYRMHQRALHGWWRLLLMLLIDRVSHALRPRLKLH